MPRLFIDLDGDVQLDRTLARWQGRVGDLRPALNEIADRVAESEKRQFSSQGAWASGRWSPLSKNYGRWKARRYPGKGILERTGRLRRSLTKRPFGLDRIRDNDMEIGTNVPYATYHQRGAGRLPQRRPLEIRARDRVDWTKILQRYVTTGETR